MSSEYDPSAGSESQRQPDLAATYNRLHHMLGMQRRSLWPVIERYKSNGDVSEFSQKERVGALEAMVFDDLWEQKILPRINNPQQFGVHGLSAVEGLRPYLKNLMHAEEGVAPVPDPDMLTENPITQSDFLYCVSFALYGNETSRNHTLSVIGDIQVSTMICEMIKWENERMKECEEGTDGPFTAHYKQYISLLSERFPEFYSEGVRYPAFRKVVKGLLFGIPFQWRVIKRFPDLAESVGLEWNGEAFDMLMHALEMLVKKIAAIHGSILLMQAQVLEMDSLDLADVIECKMIEKEGGNIVQLSVNPQVLEEMKWLLQNDATVRESMALADDGPIISCTAFYSKMFEGSLQWNKQIAKQLLIP